MIRQVQDSDPKSSVLADVSHNREHWNAVGPGYSDKWKSLGTQVLSTAELGFINKYLAANNAEKAIDIGIGNGRILEALLKSPNLRELYGIDTAERMVEVCQERFKHDSRVKALQVANLSVEPLPFAETFDFATAIRMLKYNENWRQMIAKVTNRLRTGGIFVFSIPNKNSLGQFASHALPYHSSSRAEITDLIKSYDLELLEISGFAKLPHRWYRRSDKRKVTGLVLVERTFSRILGPTLFSLELFVAVRKK